VAAAGLSPILVDTVMSIVVKLGVVNYDDVYFLNENDLLPDLSVIQARRLIMQWSTDKAAS
jgi:hypothetical protein